MSHSLLCDLDLSTASASFLPLSISSSIDFFERSKALFAILFLSALDSILIMFSIFALPLKSSLYFLRLPSLPFLVPVLSNKSLMAFSKAALSLSDFKIMLLILFPLSREYNLLPSERPFRHTLSYQRG